MGELKTDLRGRPPKKPEMKVSTKLLFFGLRDLQLGIWGAFGISFDGPKQEGSELTMEAKL